MRSMTKILGATALVAAVFSCRMDTQDSAAATAMASADDIPGTYFAADSGHNLGKNWCYSGALVLDSTKHFGSVIKMCSDDGSGPVTESIKGTYHFRTRTVKVDGGVRSRKLYVVLDQEGRGKSHTLVYDKGTLRFDEPWWMGAGLRALEIPDPVLKKISPSQLPDSPATASSTPARARVGSPTPPVAPAKKAPNKGVGTS